MHSSSENIEAFVRKHIGYASWLAVVLLSVVVLASCSGDNGSPVAPSRPGPGGPGLGGPVSGATVHGRVNTSGGVSASPLSFAPAAAVSGDAEPGLVVEVLDCMAPTGCSAEVGPNGKFMITGLDAVADVVLRVSGPGVLGEAQDVPLGTSLGADGTLEVELSVNDGGNVRVDSIEIENDSPDDDSRGNDDDDESVDDESVDDDDESHDDGSDDESADDDESEDDSSDDED